MWWKKSVPFLFLCNRTDWWHLFSRSKYVCMCHKTNILFKQIRPNGIFGLVFLHLELEGKDTASAFFCFDDVQQKYCLYLIQDSNQHANFLTYTHAYIHILFDQIIIRADFFSSCMTRYFFFFCACMNTSNWHTSVELIKYLSPLKIIYL